MIKKLEIIIEGRVEGILEIDEIGKEEIKVIKFKLEPEDKKKLHMGLFNKDISYLFSYGEYLKTVQRGIEHYLEKKVEIREYTQK